jgi:hypothetical protein
MNNIDEAIILKSEKGVDYINHEGFKIIDEIQ